MNKRIVVFLLSCLLLLSLSPISVFAADTKIRMVDVNLPDITAELSGTILLDKISSVKLDDENLEISDVYSEKNSNKLVYILVDISTSMSQSALDELKPKLISYAKSLDKSSDKLVLMTFGEKITTLLKGGESNKKIESVINSISCNAQNTSFYSALNKVYKLADKQSKYDRKFSIVISDGEDIEKGNSSQQEVIDNYKTHRLPVYGLCLSNASKNASDGFGYISRNSGGEMVSFSSHNATVKFDKLKGYFNDVTIVKLISENKKTTENKYIDFNLQSGHISQEVAVKAKADNKAPEVKNIEYDKENNSFKITFSEKVENADKLNSFKIKKGNQVYNAVSAEYNAKVTVLNMEKQIYSGEYIFELSNIIDASDNANKLDETTYTKSIKAKHVIYIVLLYAGIISVPIIFLVCILLILLFLKKKKKVTKIKDIFVTQVEEEQHETVHIKEKKGFSIKLYIDSADGNFHTIEYNLISSIIVGNSDMCDIKIDDLALSVQHFAIEQVEKGLAVTDLNSNNGTFINGVRVMSRTFLRSNDRISVGNSVIRVVYSERE